MANQSGSNTYTPPTTITHESGANPTSNSRKWTHRLDFLGHSLNSNSNSNTASNSGLEAPVETGNDGLGSQSGQDKPRESVERGERKGPSEKWYQIHLFSGMMNDIKRRLPYYVSDWTDAWDYRVVPATVYMYFANILPALAFSLDMFTKTNMGYGVNEVLLASVLGAVVFSLFAAQPLVIVGVTGPITVFNYTVYDIMVPTGTNYFAFMALVGLWSLAMHWFLAITNACNALKYVTRFSCDIFGFYVAFIYLQKGIQVLTRQGSDSPFYLSIMIALLVLATGYLCGVIGSGSLFQHYIRVFVKDYGMPLTVVFFTGFVNIGRMREVQLSTLPTSKAFFPTTDRGWFVHFWDISVGDVFVAIPFAILLTILFYFDHNVSSLISQGTEFPLRKPAGFHWDLFLLGLTTGIAGLLGIPAPNGLIPQAPFHTASLCVTKVVSDQNEETTAKGHPTHHKSHVVEQRASNLLQGLLTLGTMTGPLLIVLHLIPQGVLAGLFFAMGIQALEANGITVKIVFLCRDKQLTAKSEPLKRVERKKMVWLWVGIQLVGFGATFAVTQTAAAVAFPVIILLLIPLRILLLPKLFTEAELRILDAPTASPFTMISVGGNHGEDLSNTTSVNTPFGGSEGMLVTVGGENGGDEERAERGQGPGVGAGVGMNLAEGMGMRMGVGKGKGKGVKRRESWMGDGDGEGEERSGRWGGQGGSDGSGESYELKKGVTRRSISRQSG